MIWFTGDTHFGHEKILKYCRRPFATIEEHDRVLIENWNARVAPDDEVWHLGDFAWWHLDPARVTEIFRALNGYKHLIVGNHDIDPEGEVLDVLVDCFGSDKIHHYKEIRIGADGRRKLLSEVEEGQRLVLFHYAIRRWQGWFAKDPDQSWHLYGHHHARLMSNLASFDAGVDASRFQPNSWPEVETKFRAILSTDGDPI